MEIRNRVKTYIEEIFQEEGYTDLFLVSVEFNESNKKLEVFIESDEVLSIGRCAKLNRLLQNFIDEGGWLGEKYTLDVSSPGVGKPLKLHRQYLKNIGRRIEIFLTEGKPVTGTLKEVDENELVVVYEKGKKKKKQILEQTIAFAEIKRAVVKISF